MSTAKPSEPSAPRPLKPLARMVNFMATEIETMEVCYATTAEDGTLAWRSETAKARHAIATEVFKTLTLVEAFEGDFKAILRKRMPQKRPPQS